MRVAAFALVAAGVVQVLPACGVATRCPPVQPNEGSELAGNQPSVHDTGEVGGVAHPRAKRAREARAARGVSLTPLARGMGLSLSGRF